MIMKLVPNEWIHLMIARSTTILEIQKLVKIGWKPTYTCQSIVYKLENALTQSVASQCEVMCKKSQVESSYQHLQLSLSGGPYLIDPCKKDETQKISGFYQSLALQHLRPKGYEKCMKLPHDLYCPSTEANNADYVCPYILYKKICTRKELLLYHLFRTNLT